MVGLTLNIDRTCSKSVREKWTPVLVPVSSLHWIPTLATRTVTTKRGSITVIKRNLNFSSSVEVIHEILAVRNHLDDRPTPGSFEAYSYGAIVKIQPRTLLIRSGRGRACS